MSEEQKSSCKKGSRSMGVFGSKRLLPARSARSERSEPRERCEACSERSDEVRDCKLHTTQQTTHTEQTLLVAILHQQKQTINKHVRVWIWKFQTLANVYKTHFKR